MKTLMILSFIITMMAKGCDNNDFEKQNLPIADGFYKGTFTLTSSTSMMSGDLTIEIKGDRFTASGNSNRIPAGGSGTWSLDPDKQLIVFQDENFWTADFDWSLILSGEFNYSFNGESLVLTRNVGDGSTTQKYELKKVNL
jgi:hypothetical protein